MKKIWCLFSIANNYDQPDHNLEAWWSEKPSPETLAQFLCVDYKKKEGHDLCGKLYRMGAVKDTNHTNYRLEEVRESTKPN